MNILKLTERDFFRDGGLKPTYQRLMWLQDFVYMELPNGGINIMKGHRKGVFFSE